MIEALQYTLTYGPGSFKNIDGSTPTQQEVNEAFKKFQLEIEPNASSDDVIQSVLQKTHTQFTEPALLIAVIVPKSKTAMDRVLTFSDEFASYLKEKTSLRLDASSRMVI